MKRHISILVFLLLLTTINVSNAQTKIYVWNFLNEEGRQDEDTRKITDEFETQLSQYTNEYIVLERRDFSTGFEHQQSEKAILSLNDVGQYQSQLRTMSAEVVVFGKIVYDKVSDIFTFYAKFQNIETSQIQKSSLNISRNILQRDIVKLQDLISKFVCSLIKGKQCAQDTIKEIIKTPNKFKFGVRYGLNLSNPFTTKLVDSKSLKMVTSYHIGGFVAYNLSNAFCLESGLLFSGKGAKLVEAKTDGSFWSSSTISPLYLEMPINALNTFDLGRAKLCLFTGLYIGVGISGKIKSISVKDKNGVYAESIFGLVNESMDISFGTTVESHLKPIDVGMNIGAGLEIKNFLVRAQYSSGFYALGLKRMGAESSRSSVLGISTGYMFGGK